MIAFAMIQASQVKSELMLSSSHDIDLEMNMTTTGLSLSQTGFGSANPDTFNRYARRSALFTKLIGAHVVHAISRGQTPMMVFNGVNAFSTN